ncbi:uncharacterized protein VP01_196g3 [Puccinia sorghi]|uniref:SNF2 N-terminal domain-containing protein n=1 Tax=Puccinia sorghi TaxID=27349 RepID=A0A0L6VBZ8_9BASI|nr:uncharacterized protein VP01_196g3 [Puccinia sorghi]
MRPQMMYYMKQGGFEVLTVALIIRDRKLCLTGKPLQNHLSDLCTLLQFIGVDPWAQEEVWQAYIKPLLHQKSPKAIDLLQWLIATISLRRLKIDVLALPPKVEDNVGPQLSEPWQVNQESNGWHSADFFLQLKFTFTIKVFWKIVQSIPHHPILTGCKNPTNWELHHQFSSKFFIC